MQKRGDQVEQSIKRELARLLQGRGLTEITVAELSRAAELTRKTFYAHYTGLQTVAGELAVDLAGAALEKLEALETRGDTTLGDAFAVLDGFLLQNREMLQKLEQGGALGGLLARLQQAVQRLLARGAGVRLSELPHTARLAVSSAASGVLTLYLDHARQPDQLSLAEVTELAERMARGALAPFLPAARPEKEARHAT